MSHRQPNPETRGMKKNVHAIYTNFQKVFDNAQTRALLIKLENVGVQGAAKLSYYLLDGVVYARLNYFPSHYTNVPRVYLGDVI